MPAPAHEKRDKRNKRSGVSLTTVVLLILCALLAQWAVLRPLPDLAPRDAAPAAAVTSRNPLAIPAGRAPSLPSVRVAPAEEVERQFYGGKGDAKHLGGFTDIDMMGISPASWRHLVRMNPT